MSTTATVSVTRIQAGEYEVVHNGVTYRVWHDNGNRFMTQDWIIVKVGYGRVGSYGTKAGALRLIAEGRVSA